MTLSEWALGRMLMAPRALLARAMRSEESLRNDKVEIYEITSNAHFINETFRRSEPETFQLKQAKAEKAKREEKRKRFSDPNLTRSNKKKTFATSSELAEPEVEWISPLHSSVRRIMTKIARQ
jgi:hypothetical protein